MIDKGDVCLLAYGTDSGSGGGGIAVALEGVFRALKSAGISYRFIITHSAETLSGRWWPWCRSFGSSWQWVRIARRENKQPIAYIHMGGGFASTLRKTLLASFLRCARVPVIMQLHGLEVADYLSNPFSSRLFRLCLRAASSVAVLTPWWAELLRGSGYTKPIHVIPNVLPLACEEMARLSPQVRQGGPEVRILAMSRMVPGKGFGALLDSLPFVSVPVRLIFAGSGPKERELREQVDALDLAGRVEFLGWVREERKPEIFEAADVFCLPSKYDSFGMGYIEAMAYGLPVIALRGGAVADVVLDRETGLLVEPDDPHALAQAIETLAIDPQKRARMGARAKSHVLERYSAERVSILLWEAIKQTLCKR